MLPLSGHRPDILSLFEDILNAGSNLRVRVTGKSMIPFLRGGELLTLRQVPCPSLEKGDLILFRGAYDLPVLHRILKKRKNDDGTLCFRTKGDALMTFDEEVHERNVLGRVCEIKRSGSSGKFSHIDMNSKFRRNLNLMIAVLGCLKTQAYFFLSGMTERRQP
jgi:signal peptidase I